MAGYEVLNKVERYTGKPLLFANFLNSIKLSVKDCSHAISQKFWTPPLPRDGKLGKQETAQTFLFPQFGTH